MPRCVFLGVLFYKIFLWCPDVLILFYAQMFLILLCCVLCLDFFIVLFILFWLLFHFILLFCLCSDSVFFFYK